MNEVLGIDIGRVIIEGGTGAGDTDFRTGNHLLTPARPGALEAIAQLATGRFKGDVHLISKCYPCIEKRTREWLERNRFAEVTGITPERWHFCKERADKGPLCRTLGITHFIDDRLENLAHAADAGVTSLYWFNPEREAALEGAPQHVAVASWAELLEVLARE